MAKGVFGEARAGGREDVSDGGSATAEVGRLDGTNHTRLGRGEGRAEATISSSVMSHARVIIQAGTVAAHCPPGGLSLT